MKRKIKIKKQNQMSTLLVMILNQFFQEKIQSDLQTSSEILDLQPI